ncbi:hypothetical protein AYI68_g4571 [Smittium mucronatum]|uniref:Reverse transcriptase domain-containing protein n=1 Tax=Smittium mucronatum TaxID=133383 RepID=A0A1R0GWQ0_9FUNG|nr:hypothetical protein AYI68_g4571 [Smittium mucronatum]
MDLPGKPVQLIEANSDMLMDSECLEVLITAKKPTKKIIVRKPFLGRQKEYVSYEVNSTTLATAQITSATMDTKETNPNTSKHKRGLSGEWTRQIPSSLLWDFFQPADIYKDTHTCYQLCKEEGIKIAAYLDDIIFIANNKGRCQYDTNRVLQKLKELGFLLKESKSLLLPKQNIKKLDASETAWGIVVGSHSYPGTWNGPESTLQVKAKESFSLFYALQIPNFVGRSVLVYSDNTKKMAYVKRFGRTASSKLLKISEEIWHDCLRTNTRPQITYVPTYLNSKDAPSKLSIKNNDPSPKQSLPGLPQSTVSTT